MGAELELSGLGPLTLMRMLTQTGDRLPLGPPALMMSPQQEQPGQIPDEMVRKRDAKYDISTPRRGEDRVEDIEGPATLDPCSDLWRTTGKGWAVDLKEVPMSLGGPTPIATMQSVANPNPATE